MYPVLSFRHSLHHSRQLVVGFHHGPRVALISPFLPFNNQPVSLLVYYKMSLNDQQAQELARVLQTLAALSPQGSQRPQATHQSLPIHSATGSNSVVPGGAYPSNPSQHSHVSQLLNSLVVPPTAAAPVGHHVRVEMPILVPSQVERPRAGDSRKATPSADPATILDWPLGLRCVAKIAAQNPDFEPAIRKVNQCPSLAPP